jgi:hypothetical protein
VEDCVIETQTGFQRRRAEQQIDNAQLRASMIAIAKIGNKEHAAAAVRDTLFSSLDIGERSLWAHALTRTDAWILCGPDKASLRLGVRLGFRDRLVALETLLTDVGFRSKVPLRSNYTAQWLAQALNEMVILEGSKRS